MNNGIKNVLIFVAGIAIGAVASYKFAEAKAKQKADADIAEMREWVMSRTDSQDAEAKKEDVTEEEKDEEDISLDKAVYDYTQVLNKVSYTETKVEEEGEDAATAKPYVIPPNEFDEMGYATTSLTYYKDGILTDEDGDVLDDEHIEFYIGKDSLQTFGQYEDDSVFVRNDTLQVDYEILYDPRTHAESLRR